MKAMIIKLFEFGVETAILLLDEDVVRVVLILILIVIVLKMVMK
jgi:hypothetical protein